MYAAKSRPDAGPLQPLEALGARVERRLPAAREAHHGDALGVDASMLFQRFHRAVRIEELREAPAWKRLVQDRGGDPAAAPAVDDEGRVSPLVQLLLPIGHVSPDPARTVHQDHDRELLRSPARQPKRPRERHGLAFPPSGQEDPVR
jgi:hypothetical protein